MVGAASGDGDAAGSAGRAVAPLRNRALFSIMLYPMQAMFTGLIETTGTLRARFRNGGGWRVAVCADLPGGELPVLGESIAVQGVCLTVDAVVPGGFECDLLDETISRTTLGGLHVGARVNLERAMKAGARFGGHIVQGHVDETGAVAALVPAGRDTELRIACSRGFSRLCVEKGSVAIDGASLTIVSAGDGAIAVDLIPHTLEATSLGALRKGSRVNLEADVIGKYVMRALGAGAAARAPSGLTAGRLKEAGFDV